MRKFALIFFGILFTLSVVAQENTQTLDELQKEIDKLQVGTGSGENVGYSELEVQIKALKASHDSLAIQHELLKIEAVLYQTQLEACNSNRNSLEEVLESERAESFTNVSTDKNNNVAESNLKKGNYIVLAAFRTYTTAKKQLDEIAKEYSSMKFIVAQNHRKTWFHVCIDAPFELKMSGQKAYEARQKGFEDAWSILLN
jgi:chromosome segregation ATPase